MKKQIRACIIATIITVLLMISCAGYVSACAAERSAEAEAPEYDHGLHYPRLSVVVEKRYVGDLCIIICKDRQHNLWAFYDDEGTWDIGDIANLMLWDMGENEEEQEIIEVYWEGYTENIDAFFQTVEWR